MKFLCSCGYLIRDQTDNLPYKASSIADQRREEIFETIDRVLDYPAERDEKEKHSIMLTLSGHFKESCFLYQCPECGELHVMKNGQIYRFSPVDSDIPKRLFEVKEEAD